MSRLGPLPSLGGKGGSPLTKLSDLPPVSKAKGSDAGSAQKMTAKRLALKWYPPAIAVEFVDPKLGPESRARKFAVDLSQPKDARTLALNLQDKYPQYLGKSLIKTKQLQELITKLQVNYESARKKAATSSTSSTQSLSPAASASRTLTQSQPAAQPRATTTTTTTASPAKRKPIDEMDFGLDEDPEPEIQIEAEEDGSVHIPEDDNPDNFNKLDDDTLKKVKADMDVDFKRSFIGRDNPNYKHDTRKDFKPVEKSDFDED